MMDDQVTFEELQSAFDPELIATALEFYCGAKLRVVWWFCRPCPIVGRRRPIDLAGDLDAQKELTLGLNRIMAGVFFQQLYPSDSADAVSTHFWDISSVGALHKIVARLLREGREIKVISYNDASANIVDRFALQDKTGFELCAVPH